MVYVYTITDSPRPVVDGRVGLCDRPLEARSSGGIAAVVTTHAPQRLAPSGENVWRHEEVVERLMREHAVLPVRFGTVFGDESRLDAALARNQERLAAGLDRVRGCVELGLRVLWQPPLGPPPSSDAAAATIVDGPGRAYMAARLAEERRRQEQHRAAERLADVLHAPLTGCAFDSTKRLLVKPDLLLTAAYLVCRDMTADFRRQVEQLAAAHPDLRLLCTGPWPPYHFVPAIVEPSEAERG